MHGSVFKLLPSSIFFVSFSFENSSSRNPARQPTDVSMLKHILYTCIYLTILSINIRLNWWNLTDVFLQNLLSEHLSERNIWVFFSAMENYLVIKYVWFVFKRSVVNNQNHNWKFLLNFHIPLGMLKTVPKRDVYLRDVDTYSLPVYGIADCSIFNEYHS